MASPLTNNYQLPATVYEAPPRLARKHILNTIVEDKYAENEEEYQSAVEKITQDKGGTRLLEPQRSSGAASPVPSLTSSISSYYRNARDSSDFDDLYDVSDDDSDISPSVMTSSHSTRSVSPSSIPPDKPVRNRYPSLVIPSPHFWPNIQKAQNDSPPRPPKIPLSPAVLSLLGSDLPGPSDTPSLISSQNSDLFAGQSAPVTPDMQSHPASGEIWGQAQQQHQDDMKDKSVRQQRPIIRIRTDEESLSPQSSSLTPSDHISVRDFGYETPHHRTDSPILGPETALSPGGIELPVEALQTLQHLSLDVTDPAEMDSDPWHEMRERMEYPPRPSSADGTPASQVSEYSLSKMSIPSPGGFFSSLAGNARNTWCVTSVPVSALPPSSTTAENFYNLPWMREIPQTVERIIEVDDLDTDGPPTAKQSAVSTSTITPALGKLHTSPRFSVDEMMDLHDEDYEGALQESAEKNLDRTTTWLAAQTTYLAALRETNPANEISTQAEQERKRISSHQRNDSLGSPIRKAVKFLESETAKHEYNEPKKPVNGESQIHYQAFRHVKANQRRSDVFRHRRTRSDSLQSIRICLRQGHITRLSSEFQLNEIDRPTTHRPISMFPGKQQDKPEETTEQRVIAQVEKERQALDQIRPGMWIVEAAKFLNGGSLISSPTKGKAARSPTQIMDLAGQPYCGWAWYCARDYPKSTIHTVTTDRDHLKSPLAGPRNQRQCIVERLWNLPFSSNHFDIISARTLYAYLRTDKPPEENSDEYDLCLRECYRCLKPGGYLEFSLQDSEILNAGSRGTAVSVEFSFNLKNRGYDPSPTKSFLGRLRRAGFDDIKRAWTVLPMGSPTKQTAGFPETPPPDASSTFDKPTLSTNNGDTSSSSSSSSSSAPVVEAVRGPVGSTADVAELTGLVGSCAWEQWMLRLQRETGKTEPHQLLEGVAAVLEEGKYTGAGWRCLSGWARMPA